MLVRDARWRGQVDCSAGGVNDGRHNKQVCGRCLSAGASEPEDKDGAGRAVFDAGARAYAQQLLSRRIEIPYVSQKEQLTYTSKKPQRTTPAAPITTIRFV